MGKVVAVGLSVVHQIITIFEAPKSISLILFRCYKEFLQYSIYESFKVRFF